MPFRKIGDLPDPYKQDEIPVYANKPCRHPEHEPPGMICLPPGIYEYICPGCGRRIEFKVCRPTLNCTKELCTVG
jgi:hypothetical protein